MRGASRSQEVGDRLVASRLETDLAAVDVALAALTDARLAREPQAEVHDRCLAVLEALDDALASAEAAYRLATGPLDGLPRTRVIAVKHRPAAVQAGQVVERLRIMRQRHLLSRGPACGPSHRSGTGPAASVMPHWPESDYLAERTIYARKVLLPPTR
jgi:hypothetical protein